VCCSSCIHRYFVLLILITFEFYTLRKLHIPYCYTKLGLAISTWTFRKRAINWLENGHIMQKNIVLVQSLWAWTIFVVVCMSFSLNYCNCCVGPIKLNIYNFFGSLFRIHLKKILSPAFIITPRSVFSQGQILQSLAKYIEKISTSKI
jgi:hypothetical protein